MREEEGMVDAGDRPLRRAFIYGAAVFAAGLGLVAAHQLFSDVILSPSESSSFSVDLLMTEGERAPPDFEATDRHPGVWQNKDKLQRIFGSQEARLTNGCRARLDFLTDHIGSKLTRKIGTKHSFAPVLVGGIGDSGTRAIEGLLKLYKIAFGPTTGTGDSVAWMGKYNVTAVCIAASQFVSPTSKSKSIVDGVKVRSINSHDTYGSVNVGAFGSYKRLWNMAETTMDFGDFKQFAHTPAKLVNWWQGFEFLLSMVDYQVKHLQSNHFAWGIKHPRISTLLPLFAEAFGPDLRYIHVLRDPRDTGYMSHGNVFYKDMCSLAYGKESEKERHRVCSNANAAQRIEFDVKWTDTIVSWLEQNLQPEQYIVVRVEDLVFGADQANNGRSPGWDRLHRWLQQSGLTAEAESQTAKGEQKSTATKRFGNHEAKYGGNKFSAGTRKMLNDAVFSASPTVKNFFKRYGYRFPESKGDPSHWVPPRYWTCRSSTCVH